MDLDSQNIAATEFSYIVGPVVEVAAPFSLADFLVQSNDREGN